MENKVEKPVKSRVLKTWSVTEEEQLLKEIADNLDNETIAANHARTVGGIISRVKEVAYKMHIKKVPMDEIIAKTKLTIEEVNLIISKKETAKKVKEEKIKEKKEEEKKIDIPNIQEQLKIINEKLDLIFKELQRK